MVCTGPVTYVGQAELKKEIDVTIATAGTDDVFLTSTAPASLEVYRRNRYYKSDEEYVFALAEAMRVEYEAIANSGLILQVDDAWLPALWDRIGMAMGIEAFRARSEMRIEALNHALRNIPEDRIRYHLCWGSWHGPHAYDLEFARIVDIVLKVKAQAYLIEGANARHEHEYAVWEKIKVACGKDSHPGRASPIRPTWSSIRNWCRSASSAMRGWSAKRMSLPGPIAASAAVRIRKSPGPNCAPWSRARRWRARRWDLRRLEPHLRKSRLRRKQTAHTRKIGLSRPLGRCRSGKIGGRAPWLLGWLLPRSMSSI